MGSASAESIAAQALSNVESNFDLRGGLPKGAARRALDADVAGEGERVNQRGHVILSNGDQVPYVKPVEQLRIPDWSQIESIKHYFGARGYQPYPSWIYHPTKDPVLVKDSTEAAQYGIVFRKTNEDERQRYGRNETWDWEAGVDWRPHPVGKLKINFADHSGSKNLVSGSPDPHRVQSDLVAAVAASVTQALKQSPATAAPAAVDPKLWDEFISFQAWKKANEVVAAEVMRENVNVGPEEPSGPDVENALSPSALTPEQDRALWETEAERLGIKVDGRWSTSRLQAEVEKAS
jgi:hypothetical protein